ncbi:hypothetical protein CPC16_001400 [Podila verticillata]|nr:hypothetical protein CPC16_001400 [Podila verticillata]
MGSLFPMDTVISSWLRVVFVVIGTVSHHLFGARDVQQRIDYMERLKEAMSGDFTEADSILTAIECGDFNKNEVKERKRNPDLEAKYKNFVYHRTRRGLEHRIADWTYEKYRFIIDICRGRSLVRWMKFEGKADFDRVINTDPYDLSMVVYMEHELNFAKAPMSIFKTSDAFDFSGETFKPRWAISWVSRLAEMNQNPVSSVMKYVAPLLDDPDDTHQLESALLLSSSLLENEEDQSQFIELPEPVPEYTTRKRTVPKRLYQSTLSLSPAAKKTRSRRD